MLRIISRNLGINANTSAVAGINFDCPEEFGYYSHPNNCTQYYVCVFGGALLESCSGGLMYSHELQTCDWPRNVGCELAGIKTSAPSSFSKNNTIKMIQSSRHQIPQVRFSTVSSYPHQQYQQSQAQQLKPQIVVQRQQSQNFEKQIMEMQLQSILPPPPLHIAPNPVITSRGQPKHKSIESEEEIAKVRTIRIFNFTFYTYM